MSDLGPMLRLDLFALAGVRRNLLILLVMAALFPLLGGPTFALPLLTLGAVMSANHLFQVDETYHLRTLYGTLPLRRSTVLASHYLVTVVLLAVFLSLGAAFLVVGGLVRDGAVPAGLGVLVGGVGAAMLLVLSVQIPVIVRVGVQRAAWVVLLAFTAVLGSTLLLPEATVLGAIARFGQATTAPALVAGVALAGAAALAVSYHVAVRMYERQDH